MFPIRRARPLAMLACMPPGVVRTSKPAARVELGLLGPLSVCVEGRPTAVPGRLARALLAILALDTGRSLSVAAIIERLWDEPPTSARNTLQTYVAHLRRVLEPWRAPGGPNAVLETAGDGYRLVGSAVAVDVADFEELMVAARTADEPAEQLATAETALALWRGEPLADLGPVRYAHGERARLGELERDAHQLRAEALMALGHSHAAIAAADAALGANPYDEAMWGLGILARYRAGRPADALAAYHRARDVLATDLGLEPSAPLRALEAAVLAHDPTLLPGPERPPRATARPTCRSAPLRVVVGEDDLLVREGLLRLLARSGDVTVVAATATYDEALDAVERHRPDVLMTDIRMPPHQRDEGIRIAGELRVRRPDVGVVLLSQLADPHYARQVFMPTATRRGYLLKEHVGRPDQLLTALLTVAIVDLLVTSGEGEGRHRP
ncbi:MAG: response regulator [Acidimicrobiia bacterium]|nr:response regulator [Acidimicrobiia bacterium]